MHKDIKKLMINTNIKLTGARTAILEVLIRSKKPLSYEDIKQQMAISMDKATFYRNITKFELEHIINSFESNDKKRYFEIQKTPHAHFICTACNLVECIDDYKLTMIKGHKVDNIIIKGTCARCLTG